jgi:glycosyltransferase involved in cell wall biosynthesis
VIALAGRHVALNLLYWRDDSGGSGTYARELLRALRTSEPDMRISAWVSRDAPAGLESCDWGGPVHWIRLPVHASGSPARLGYELALMGVAARRRGIDLVHGLAYGCPLFAPGVATVVTLLDLTWLEYPRTVTPTARRMFQILTATCGRSADRVIAISEAARADLVRKARIPADKIDVTSLAGATPGRQAATPATELRSRLQLPERAPVLLCVGQVAPHKNHEVLVRALADLPEAVLVVAGRTTGHERRLAELAAELGVVERIRWAGFVEQAGLEGLYSLADILVLPSLQEGFGLPIAEAMERGVPVACSGRGALAEVAGGAAELFEPSDAGAVAAAVRTLLGDAGRRGALIDAGHARASALTWQRTAEATLASYGRALGG